MGFKKLFLKKGVAKMKGYLNVANSPALWLAVVPVVTIVFIQAAIFLKRALASADQVGLTREEVKQAFRSGAISSIGPALSVFVVMLGLMAVIGGPLAWQRLAIIGAAPTELTAAEMAAKAMETTLDSPEYGLKNFANAAWVMALNGSGWLVVTALFSHKLDVINKKISGGNSKIAGLIGTAAMCGAMAYLFGSNAIKGGGNTISAMVAGITMLLLGAVSKRFPKLTEYNLGIAMVIGMVVAVLAV